MKEFDFGRPKILEIEKPDNLKDQDFGNKDFDQKIKLIEPILEKFGIGRESIFGVVPLVAGEDQLESAILQTWKNIIEEYGVGRRVDTTPTGQDLLSILAPNQIDWRQKKEKGDLIETAEHEQGHAFVAKALGWGVGVITVERHGPVLGYTEVAAPAKSQDNIIFDNIVICFGGKAAESACGIYDHSGCGSDMAKADYLAEYYSRLTGNKVKAGKILSMAQSMAQSIISSRNGKVRNSAGVLAEKKVA